MYKSEEPQPTMSLAFQICLPDTDSVATPPEGCPPTRTPHAPLHFFPAVDKSQPLHTPVAESYCCLPLSPVRRGTLMSPPLLPMRHFC